MYLDEADTAQLITQEPNEGENIEDKSVPTEEVIKTEDSVPENQKSDDQNDESPEVDPEDNSEDRPAAITVEEDPVLQAALSPSFEESSSFEEMDKKKRLKKMLINVIVLGMSFLLMYTAFQVRILISLPSLPKVALWCR